MGLSKEGPPISPYRSLESTVSTGQEQAYRKNMSDFTLLPRFKKQDKRKIHR